MTPTDINKAALVLFAAREAGPRASFNEMKGICLCMRNRVRAGWHDGDMLRAIEGAGEYRAHERSELQIDPNHRPFQVLTREIDDIFHGGVGMSSEGAGLEESLMEPGHESKYWAWLGRPMREWFTENVVRDRENHPQRSQLGLMMFYE